ncbi:MAG: Ig-like domain-containing protein, partial [Alistipes sp.]|nr:Ig-like domain-containing protein [Alistipes sp.]
MKKYLLSTFAIVALLFAACGGDDGVSTTVPVSGIKLDKSSLSLEIGEKATLTATIAPSDATNKSITWSSANSSIATVNNGVVSGVAAGETTITAKTNDGGFTASATVKVTPEAVKVTQIKLVGVPTEAKEGRITTISAVITPTDATDMTVTFTSSNPDVVKVEFTKSESNYSLATLTAVGPGKAKITATANDGSGVKAEAEVTVIPVIKVSEIKIGPENATIALGETKQFAAAISPADAENREVEWSSSDPSVATIKVTNTNYIAEVTGVGKGKATITATAKDGSGVTGETTIEVLGAKPTAISFDGETNNFQFRSWYGKEIDFTKDLKMKVEPAGADIRHIEWDITYALSNDYPDALKYNISNDNVIASVSTTDNMNQGTIQIEAKVDGTRIAHGYVILNNIPLLFYSYGLSDKTTTTLAALFDDYSYNWNSGSYKDNGLNFITYCYPANQNASYAENQIPASEYTLTSSDESKIKVTKLTTGEGYQIKRLDWDTLVAVTLTYKCG